MPDSCGTVSNMTTTKHRANLRTVRQYVGTRQDFDCNGTLEGRSGSHSTYVGRLPGRFHDAFAAASIASDFYVVKSYVTPIAWFANGQWFVPAVKYSPTTSRHLSSLGLPTNWAKTPKGADYVTLGGF